MELFPILMYIAWIFFIVSTFSMLWKENPFYRFVQYGAIAQAMTAAIFGAWAKIYKVALLPLSQGNLLMLVPLIMGCLILTNRLGLKYNWLARYPLALGIGVGTALSMSGAIPTQIIAQTQLIIKNATIESGINGVIFVITAISALVYFFFYFLHKTSPGRAVGYVGRYSIMIWAGCFFGTMLMMNIIFLTYAVLYTGSFGVPPPPSDLPAYIGGIIVFIIIMVSIYTWSKRQTTETSELIESL